MTSEFAYSSDRGKVISIGEYVQKLLEDKGYFNTVLPRIPVLIQREIIKKLLTVGERRALRDINE